MSERVKRKRGFTVISRKHQVTIPSEVLQAAGLHPGDRLRVTLDGDNSIVLAATIDPVDALIGSLPGLTDAVGLEALRDEWAR